MHRITRMSSGNTLKLGLFAPNCDNGMAITTVPERWKATWENNLKLARLADDAGLEFLLPVARWIGFGGTPEFQRQSLETLTWAEGVLANTKDLMAFGTIHAPMIHPIVAAKQIATIDHVSGGRFGVNVVCGWNEPEFKMFGLTQRAHDDRYVYGQEWLDVIRTIWRSEDPVDYSATAIFSSPRSSIMIAATPTCLRSPIVPARNTDVSSVCSQSPTSCAARPVPRRMSTTTTTPTSRPTGKRPTA